MNIENLRKELEQGDTFTYKKLCEVLEEEYNGGCKKKKQLEDWERYFDYEKNKTKIKILNIRDRPLPDVNKMLGKSKYYSDLETIILYALNEAKDGVIELTPYKMLNYCNFVSHNYVDCVLKNDLDDDIASFRLFLVTKIEDVFKNTINTMENLNLVEKIFSNTSRESKTCYKLKLNKNNLTKRNIILEDCTKCRKNLRNVFITTIKDSGSKEYTFDKDFIINIFCTKEDEFNWLEENEDFTFISGSKRRRIKNKEDSYLKNINNTYNKAYIYKYVNNDGEIVYIGKTKNLKIRLYQHSTAIDDNHSWYNDRLHIFYVELKEYGDCSIVEPYLIMKYHPIGNLDFNRNEKSFVIEEFENLEWIQCK